MDEVYDFKVPPETWWARARYTPVTDAFRGQLSGRLDLRREIAAAELPEQVPGLIWHVARRTRLWRSEQVDVVRELVAHFSDGLAAGRTGEQLLADFGPPDAAARLIRRAKRRNRSRAWRSWFWLSRGALIVLALALLCYAAIALRFFFSRSNVARNYWDEINAPRHVVDTDRAWPFYRDAIFQLGRPIGPDWSDRLPGQKHWEDNLAWIERHQGTLALIREGTKKPKLGYLIGDRGDLVAAEAAGADWFMKAGQSLAGDNRELIAAPLPAVQEARRLSRLLAGDAHRAALAGDSATVLADLTAMISLAAQLLQPKAFFVDQLVAVALFNYAAETTGQILLAHADVLNDTQLRNLAHRFAAYGGEHGSLDFDAEIMMFDDLLQRIYSDDGAGDGRVTPEGLKLLASLLDHGVFSRDAKETSRAVEFGTQLASPGVSQLIAPRKQSRDLYMSLLSRAQAAHQGPPWQWDAREIDVLNDHVSRVADTPLTRLRHSLVFALFPAIGSVYAAVEHQAMQRDGAETAIALVLWKRRHGQWPEALAQMVPDLLPAVPIDRATGGPLGYTVRDGQAVLYSVGADRDDDQGRAAERPDEARPRYGALDSEQLEAQRRVAVDGDWVLWPAPVAPVAEDDIPPIAEKDASLPEGESDGVP